MNIQFMTNEKNGIPTGFKDWNGKIKYRYIPDFQRLLNNAACNEEIAAIKDCEERVKSGIFNGFTFPIVYTGLCISAVYDSESKFVEYKPKWQILQHPWTETESGLKVPEEIMVRKIQEQYISTLQEMVKK